MAPLLKSRRPLQSLAYKALPLLTLQGDRVYTDASRAPSPDQGVPLTAPSAHCMLPSMYILPRAHRFAWHHLV